MTKVLLVDDDPVVLKVYQEGLARSGVQVEVASTGDGAIKTLRNGKCDLVVLDLMMPSLTGVDVLKFIRKEPAIKSLPVVLLSNSFMNALAREAAKLGVQKTLLKIRCSPPVLFGAIEEVLARKTAAKPAAALRSAPPPAPPASAKAARSTGPATARTAAGESRTGFHSGARSHFLDQAPATCSQLRGLCQRVITAAAPQSRGPRLQALYREVHRVAANAGMAQCHQLAQMASAFEAMLFEVLNKPDRLNASVLRTIAATIDLIALLYDCSQDGELDVPLSAQALVVEDEPISARGMETALKAAQVDVTAAKDGKSALQRLQETRYDLVLLDIELPDLDGLEVCRRLRKLPGYKRTPVIFVTIYRDFETRARTALSGGDDMISKPVFPMELTVKALAHLIKRVIPA